MNLGPAVATVILFSCLYYVVGYILLYPVKLVMRLAK